MKEYFVDYFKYFGGSLEEMMAFLKLHWFGYIVMITAIFGIAYTIFRAPDLIRKIKEISLDKE